MKNKKPIKELPNSTFIYISVALAICILFIGAYFYSESDMQKDTTNNKNPAEKVVKEPAKQPVDVAEDVVEANNMFAVDMYHAYRQEEGNIFFSPMSISSAVAMTYEGAMGETKDQIQETLHFPADSIKMQQEYAALFESINSNSSEYMLSIANALWGQDGVQLNPEFIQLIKDSYGGDLKEVDFETKTEESRVTINDWVEDQTNDKIKELLPQGVVTGDTKLVLTNAIYFKGDWLKQFDEENTTDQPFTKLDGSKVDVEMMSKTDDESKFGFYEDDELKVLEMPYDGEDLSMVVILPSDEDGNFAEVEENLSSEQISEFVGQVQEQNVDVWIPKFKLETSFKLKETLSGLGMPLAMSDQADFSEISEEVSLKIDDVVHKAFIEVNEEGTEAAAATGIVMAPTSAVEDEPPKPQFYADSPFIFAIIQKETGNILFMGRITDPTVESSEFAKPSFMDSEEPISMISVLRNDGGRTREEYVVSSDGDVTYTSLMSGEGYVKKSTIYESEYRVIDDIVTTSNFLQTENNPDWSAHEGEKIDIIISVSSPDGENKIGCDEDLCPPELITIYQEVKDVSEAVFGTTCESYLDCLDIKCEGISTTVDVEGEEYPSVCRAAEEGGDRSCTCKK